MSDTKFTPGPWDAQPDDLGIMHGHQPYSVVTDGVKTVAAVLVSKQDGDEMAANSYLIAAAPRMYEALKEMIKNDYATGSADHYARTAKARAALAAARGEDA